MEYAGSRMQKDIDSLQRIGNFKLTDTSIKNKGYEFDHVSQSRNMPDAVLVNDGSVSGNNLEHAMIFLNMKNTSDTLPMYVALDPDTPEDKLSELNRNGGMIFQNSPGGPHTGIVFVSKSDKDSVPFESAFQRLNDMNLETVKYPFDRVSLSDLPMFVERGVLSSLPNDDAIMNNLKSVMHEYVDQFDAPKDVLDRARGLEREPDYKRDIESNAPRPSMSR
jgi:hypothetical protein